MKEQASLTIMHLYPELLNLYGDTGNIQVLKKRLEWRGLTAEVIPVKLGQKLDVARADIIFIGGGSDREQQIVGDELASYTAPLTSYINDGGVLLAVCGGYQLLGTSYDLGTSQVRGLALLDFYTKAQEPRLIGNIIVKAGIAKTNVVGYENHAGRTYLSADLTPFAKVVMGQGNTGEGRDSGEGVQYKNVIGTYIHGPLLPKNPEVADWLLQAALNRKYQTGAPKLTPLNDTEELAANLAVQRMVFSEGQRRNHG